VRKEKGLVVLINSLATHFVISDEYLKSEVEFETPQCCYLDFSTFLSPFKPIRVVIK